MCQALHYMWKIWKIKNQIGCPWWLSSMDMGSIPGLGRFRALGSSSVPAPRVLSLCSRARSSSCWAREPRPPRPPRPPRLPRPRCPRALAPQQERPLQRDACAPQLGKSPRSSEDPVQPKMKKEVQLCKESGRHLALDLSTSSRSISRYKDNLPRSEKSPFQRLKWRQ